MRRGGAAGVGEEEGAGRGGGAGAGAVPPPVAGRPGRRRVPLVTGCCGGAFAAAEWSVDRLPLGWPGRPGPTKWPVDRRPLTACNSPADPAAATEWSTGDSERAVRRAAAAAAAAAACQWVGGGARFDVLPRALRRRALAAAAGWLWGDSERAARQRRRGWDAGARSTRPRARPSRLPRRTPPARSFAGASDHASDIGSGQLDSKDVLTFSMELC
jgi:hypothetical protein